MSHVPVLGDLFEHFYYDSIFWCICFLLGLFSIQYLLTSLFPKMITDIADAKTRRDYFNYYLCLGHHAIVVPLALYRMLTMESSISVSSFMISGGKNYTTETKDFYYCESSPYMTGYLLADLITYAIPLAMEGDFIYLGHHFMSLGVSALVPFLTAEVAVYCSRIMLLEASSIFFGIRFIVMNSGYKKGVFLTVLEAGFVVSFFFCRIVNLSMLLPQIYYGLISDPLSSDSEIKLGWILLSLFGPLWALQVFWFYKIFEIIKSTMITGVTTAGTSIPVGDDINILNPKKNN